MVRINIGGACSSSNGKSSKKENFLRNIQETCSKMQSFVHFFWTNYIHNIPTLFFSSLVELVNDSKTSLPEIYKKNINFKNIKKI